MTDNRDNLQLAMSPTLSKILHSFGKEKGRQCLG